MTPLVTPVSGPPWGFHSYDEHFASTFFGMQQKITPRRNIPELGPLPFLAAEITGNMKRAYPLPEKEDSDTKAGETPEDTDATADNSGGEETAADSGNEADRI